MTGDAQFPVDPAADDLMGGDHGLEPFDPADPVPAGFEIDDLIAEAPAPGLDLVVPGVDDAALPGLPGGPGGLPGGGPGGLPGGGPGGLPGGGPGGIDPPAGWWDDAEQGRFDALFGDEDSDVLRVELLSTMRGSLSPEEAWARVLDVHGDDPALLAEAAHVVWGDAATDHVDRPMPASWLDGSWRTELADRFDEAFPDGRYTATDLERVIEQADNPADAYRLLANHNGLGPGTPAIDMGSFDAAAHWLFGDESEQWVGRGLTIEASWWDDVEQDRFADVFGVADQRETDFLTRLAEADSPEEAWQWARATYGTPFETTVGFGAMSEDRLRLAELGHVIFGDEATAHGAPALPDEWTTGAWRAEALGRVDEAFREHPEHAAWMREQVADLDTPADAWRYVSNWHDEGTGTPHLDLADEVAHTLFGDGSEQWVGYGLGGEQPVDPWWDDTEQARFDAVFGDERGGLAGSIEARLKESGNPFEAWAALSEQYANDPLRLAEVAHVVWGDEAGLHVAHTLPESWLADGDPWRTEIAERWGEAFPDGLAESDRQQLQALIDGADTPADAWRAIEAAVTGPAGPGPAGVPSGAASVSPPVLVPGGIDGGLIDGAAHLVFGDGSEDLVAHGIVPGATNPGGGQPGGGLPGGGLPGGGNPDGGLPGGSNPGGGVPGAGTPGGGTLPEGTAPPGGAVPIAGGGLPSGPGAPAAPPLGAGDVTLTSAGPPAPPSSPPGMVTPGGPPAAPGSFDGVLPGIGASVLDGPLPPGGMPGAPDGSSLPGGLEPPGDLDLPGGSDLLPPVGLPQPPDGGVAPGVDPVSDDDDPLASAGEIAALGGAAVVAGSLGAALGSRSGSRRGQAEATDAGVESNGSGEAPQHRPAPPSS